MLITRNIKMSEALVEINNFIASKAYSEATNKEKQLILQIKKQLKTKIKTYNDGKSR